MTDIVDQPAPIASSHRPAWDLVIEGLEHERERHESNSVALGWSRELFDQVLADMHKRDRLGRERYGVPLQAGNGRNHLIDAYQELLDGIVYLRAWLDEHPVVVGADDVGTTSVIAVLYADAIQRAFSLRRFI